MAKSKSESEVIQLSDDLTQAIKAIADHFALEDRATRNRQIRQWKRLKYYWNGFFRIWWSEVAHDWRVWDQSAGVGTDYDDFAYDKPINLFRGFLESVIAALTVAVPSVQCTPDDASNPLDISTAKAGNKVQELIYKHNNVMLIWIQAFYIYCTEGMVACYSRPECSKKYGMYDEDEYKDEEIEQQVKICPNCQQNMVDVDMMQDEQDEFAPGDEDANLHALLNKGQELCPNCMAMVDPELQTEKMVITRLVGKTKHPKSRVKLDVLGGLNVKVPNYARNQEDCPYLEFSEEVHYSVAMDRYSDIKDKIKGQGGPVSGSGGANDPYERWGRLSPQYYGEFPTNTVTVRKVWLRPCTYGIVDDKFTTELEEKFPDGLCATFVNDNFADVYNSALDDYWTLTKNPTSDYVHYDPLGMLLTSVQEISNDIISLTLQTMEHGIPQTFVNPRVLNPEQYRKSEARPGDLIFTNPSSGANIADNFATIKTASLSPEVQPFQDKIFEAGQFVSGALPSIYGGASTGSGRTAAQYSMQRAQALQRLQTPWKMFTFWWKEIFGKAIPMFLKEMKDDEKFTTKDKNTNNFVNVFIRKSETLGKIGSVELEASDQLPITYAQKQDLIQKLLQSGNPQLMQAVMSPQNLPILKQIIGLDEFIVQGEDDRQKQYEEIQLLIQGEPQDDGTGNQVSTILPEPYVDNHFVEADICRQFLVSDAGRLLKTENPQGYQNVLMHMQMHLQMEAMASQPPPGGKEPGVAQQNNSPSTPQPEQGNPNAGSTSVANSHQQSVVGQ